MKTLKILLFFLGWSAWLAAQSSDAVVFQINSVKLNEADKTLDIYLNAKINGQPFDPDRTSLVVREKKIKSDSATLQNIDQVLDQSEFQIIPPTVLFLLDISGSMCGEKLEEAKKAIYNTLIQQGLSPRTTFFATFHDEVSEMQLLNKDNFDQVVQPVTACGKKNTDLYFAIQQKINELKYRSGRRILFVLTDGQNDIRGNRRYLNGNTPAPTQELVYESARGLDQNFQIYAIGLGDPSVNGSLQGLDEDFLRQLVNDSSNPDDLFLHAQSPADLRGAFETAGKQIEENLVIKVFPGDCEYIGSQRDLFIEFAYEHYTGSANYRYSRGSSASSINICPEIPKTDYASIFFTGLLIIAVILALMLYLIPAFSFIAFKSKWVMTYAEYLKLSGLSANVRRSDPYTQETFQLKDKVVTRCEHLMKLDSWQSNGDKCVYYPSKCNCGTGEYKKGVNFFLQQGVNRKLNWLWFGAVGGLASWALFILLQEVLRFEWFKTAVLDQIPSIARFSDQLNRQLLIGIALGLCISFALALVEELGASRKWSIARIVTRVLLSLIIAIPIFFFAELFYLKVFSHPFFGRLVGWGLFGTALGIITTINSGIDFRKGLKGGILASGIAFLLYYMLDHLIPNPHYSTLAALICYGAVLGLILVAVVERLEKFEMEILSPSEFSGRKFSISKWLTAPEIKQIFIGTDQNCHVFLKWADPVVSARHAILKYNGRVFIEPVGETLINNRLITRETELQHGDVIRLGAKSRTAIRFLSRQKVAPAVPQALPAFDPEQTVPLNGRIKIKRI